MIKRVFLINLILWCTMISATSQVSTSGEKALMEKGYIHMKDGSVVKGKYIYSSDLEKIRIMQGKESKIIDASEVEKITLNKPEAATRQAREKGDAEFFDIRPAKWFNLSEGGVMIGNPDNEHKAPFLFHSSMNYSFRNNLSAGAGIGVEFYNETYLPVFANLLYKFNNRKVSPFVSLQAGYLIALENKTRISGGYYPYDYLSSYWPQPITRDNLDAQGGFLINPSAGLFFKTSHGYGITLSAGYRFHQLRFSDNSDYKLRADYNRLSIKLGILFH
ncbi:hypothetical protein ACOMSG_09995 [Macellibacteroides fermentans]|uniref:hypothetical protein n=1 Tax=Macellibacteroides fermentans TaxID=879969 RepID=UPI003B93BE42